MNIFISCDWGTSAFRLRLVNAGTAEVLGEIKTNQGIASVYNRWKEDSENTNRLSFYTTILSAGIVQLAEKAAADLQNTTVVISGMASSSIGMLELPYKDLPFLTNGADIQTHFTPSTETFAHPILFISGAKTADDVMRGEETKLIGCELPDEYGEQLIIIPGTHAKHVIAEGEKITNFKTFMTGEMFSLLSTKSVLASSVEENKEEHTNFFIRGVRESINNPLLNILFHVRTNRLFNYQSEKQNYHYLSGLLIGSELQDITIKNYRTITLLATGIFMQLYTQALQTLGFTNVICKDADVALLEGQCILYQQSQNHKP